MIHRIEPVAKPRMTNKDRWVKRPCVQRYWQYKADVRKMGLELPVQSAKIVFWISMPKSWSKAKKSDMLGQPHQQRPDLDNLLKGLFDAVYGEDCVVWHLSGLEKRWAVHGAISIVV